MTWKAGQSGNPRGRPPGAVTKHAALRTAIEQHVPEILNALIDSAKRGDTTAAKLILERCLPALKPQGTPVTVTMGETLTESGQRILKAIGAGEITPEQGGSLLSGLGVLARVIEVDELSRRIDALERGQAPQETSDP